VRAVAKQLKISKSTVSDIKVHKLGIKARVWRPVPKQSQNQEERSKKSTRKIYKKCLIKVLVVDDETYMILDPREAPGRKFFHSTGAKGIKFDHKLKCKSKFLKEILVLQEMDENGNVSDPYITEGTINAQISLNECAKKPLISFVREHHKIEYILFWSDMATSDYAKVVTDYLEAENVDFVKKTDNPANIPKLWGIEKFWALCKAKFLLEKWSNECARFSSNLDQNQHAGGNGIWKIYNETLLEASSE